MICPSCSKNTLKPMRGAGRVVRYGCIARLSIPRNLPILSCSSCGRYLTEEPKAVADQLAVLYRRCLQDSAKRSIGCLMAATSQLQLEKLLGISQGYLSKIRRGSAVPSETLVLLLYTLATDPAGELRKAAQFWQELGELPNLVNGRS